MSSSSFAVHADILKMAKTKEKREAIKWFHARRFFFEKENFRAGLELARQSEHPDARLLVSLFPEAPPAKKEEALAVFMARQDDPRCLCWAGALTEGEVGEELFKRSAESGCAWAQTHRMKKLQKSEKVAMLERAVAQGEPKALFRRAEYAWDGSFCSVHTERGMLWWLQGAELGDPACQREFALRCCDNNSVARYEWLRRAAVQDTIVYFHLLAGDAVNQVTRFVLGGSGRILFEIGAAVVVAKRYQRYWACIDGREQKNCVSASSCGVHALH